MNENCQITEETEPELTCNLLGLHLNELLAKGSNGSYQTTQFVSKIAHFSTQSDGKSPLLKTPTNSVNMEK